MTLPHKCCFSLVLSIFLSMPGFAADVDALMNMSLDTPVELRNSYNEAIKLHSEGKDDEACRNLSELVRSLPNFIPAHLLYAASLEKLGKLSDSVSELETASRIRPDESSVLRSLGRAYQISGRRSEAIKQFERYIWLYPDADDVDYIKNAVSQMKMEEDKKDIFTDTRGQDNYLAEILSQKASRWKFDRMPLTVFIQSGSGVAGYKPELDGVLRQAFSDWASAGMGKLSFRFVDRPELALIQCRWTDDIRDFENPIEAGETKSLTLGPELRSAKIVLLCGGKARSVSEIKGVCLHELGHALGILGHSSDPGDIMFMFSRSGDKRSLQLSPRDIKTLNSLYSMSDEEIGRYHGAAWQNKVKAAELGRLVNLAESDFRSGKYAESAASLESALRLAPGETSLRENLGNAYANLGRQELRNKQYIKYQKHFELAASNLKSAGRTDRAAELYEALSKFSTLMQDSASASLYQAEARKLKRAAATK